MKLEIGNFPVKDVCFGKVTSYKDAVLTINKEEAISFLRESNENLTDIDIEIAKPGESIRIVPIKEAVEPRVRPDGRATFPGITGEVATCGEGVVHALKGCAVLGVGKMWGGFQDGVIDMGGDGAKYTYYSQLINICLVMATNEDFEKNDNHKRNVAIRWATHRFAEYLAKVTIKDLTPPEKDVLEFTPVTKRSKEVNALPSLVYVIQVQSQMEVDGDFNARFYGWNINHYLPSFVPPTAILDGAMISGSMMPASSKWSTYDWQNSPTLREIMKEHGKTLNFLGVILAHNNPAQEQKMRAAIRIAETAVALGADGAILAEEGYGNPDSDYVACIVALEDAGVKTVGVSNECTGRDGASQPLMTLDVKLNALVSAGNVSQLLDIPATERVIGNLEALGRDGSSGAWAHDDVLGPSVRKDGSIIVENNTMFCADQVVGWSPKVMIEV